MLNSLIDLLMLCLSIIGYFSTFFTAFKMTVPLWLLGLLMILASISYYGLMNKNKKIKMIWLVGVIILVGILLPFFSNGFKMFLSTIFDSYEAADRTFIRPIVEFASVEMDYYIALLVINLPIVLSLAHYYTSHKHVFIHHLPAIIFMFIPILFQYFPPYIYLILFVGVLFTNYLTKSVHQIALVRLALLGGLTLIPFVVVIHTMPEEYEPPFHFESLRLKINNSGKEIYGDQPIEKMIDLSQVGKIDPTDNVEYYVKGNYVGSFKIYGQRYGTYQENQWITVVDSGAEILMPVSLRIMNLHYEHVPHSIRITNPFQVLSSNYEPYFVSFSSPGSYTFITYEGMYENHFDDLNPVHIQAINNYIRDNGHYFNEVPSALYSILDEAILEAGILETDSPYQKVVKIRQYFQKEFTYTYHVERINEGEDFVAHFLETKQGYCIHFASAATLMLRRAGVLARYVTGYQLSYYDRDSYLARNRDEHAWVEYFDTNVGWLPIEVTTAYSIDDTLASYEKIEYHDRNLEENLEDEFSDDEITLPHQQENQAEQTTNIAMKNTNQFSMIWIYGMLLLGSIILVRLIRQLRFRKYALHSTNQYICFLYHQLDRLHIQVDQKHLQIALEAMYSNQAIKKEDAKEFESYYTSLILQKNILIRYYYLVKGQKND